MLMITSFENPRVAQAFVDYMATQGVILTIQHSVHFDIWLADDSREDVVRDELQRFLSNPGDGRYLAASWQSGQTHSGLRYRRFPFWSTLRNNAGPLTITMIVLCVVVYVLMQVLGDQTVMLWLAWPFDPPLKYDLWRYFTHALLHFSLLHITFNLIWWWYLGGPVEKRLGTRKLLVITLISALFSGFIQHKLSGAWFGGLSGVVYALMGYVWLRGMRDPGCGVNLPGGLMAFALIWLVIGWFGMPGMSIANGAHASGLLVGLIIALVDSANARKRT